jgi:hypothetical protein
MTDLDWWNDLDSDLLRCVDARGVVTPAEIGHKLGVSENAAASLLALLAAEGKVRIVAVEAGNSARAARPA